MYFNWNRLKAIYFLAGNVNRFVEDDPSGCFPTAWMSRRSFVGHVVIRFRKKSVYGNVS